MQLSELLKTLILGTIGDPSSAQELIDAIETGENSVTSLNDLQGDVTLVAGSNVTITPSGNNLTIASTGGSVFTGDPNALVFCDVDGNLTTDPNLSYDGGSLQIPGDISPLDDAVNLIGQDGAQYSEIWSSAFKSTDTVAITSGNNITISIGGSNKKLIIDGGDTNLNNNNLINAASVGLKDAGDNFQVILAAPQTGMAADLNLVMPAIDGDSGDVLTTDGFGNLTFQTVSGGGGTILSVITTPGGGQNLAVPAYTQLPTNTIQIVSGSASLIDNASGSFVAVHTGPHYLIANVFSSTFNAPCAIQIGYIINNVPGVWEVINSSSTDGSGYRAVPGMTAIMNLTAGDKVQVMCHGLTTNADNWTSEFGEVTPH